MGRQSSKIYVLIKWNNMRCGEDMHAYRKQMQGKTRENEWVVAAIS